MSQLTVTVDKLNKRKSIPAVLPDNNSIIGIVYKGYSFEGDLAATNSNGTWYKDRDNNYYWGKALQVVEIPAPTPQVTTTDSKAAIPTVDFSNLDLPVTQTQCLNCAAWMKNNFESSFDAIVADTVFEKELLYAIACQETAIYWNGWMNDHTPDEILGRCVFDASGDVNGSRSAFPKNTAVFIDKYGQAIADTLIAEANATRAWRGWGPKQWVYAGYGIFQYDIQAILTDEIFFTGKQWYAIDNCLNRVMKELKAKWQAHPNDLFNTVKAYNGSGAKADNYAKNVMRFYTWIKAGLTT
jgi:hypothetical protein